MPWIHRIFEHYLIGKPMRITVADLLLNTLANALLAQEKKLPNFHVVDTRDTLDRADIDTKSNNGDWLNDINPNSGSYRKIANKLAARLDKVIECSLAAKRICGRRVKDRRRGGIHPGPRGIRDRRCQRTTAVCNP